MRPSRILFFLFILFSACGDCVDTEHEVDLFKPFVFGEYEFDGKPKLDAPDRVLFGELNIGETSGKVITIKNIGDDILKFEKWEINDTFQFEFFGINKTVEILKPGESIDLVITHKATTLEGVTGSFFIHSNDPDSPILEIKLIVNAQLPCLETIPQTLLEFGEVEKNTKAEKPILLHNCSASTTTRFSIVSLDGDREFSIPNQNTFQDIELAPDETIQIFVLFTPQNIREYEGSISFSSNDATHPIQKVKLHAIGSKGRCPKASFVATHPERTQASADPIGTFNGVPLDTVNFDGSLSRAFGGRVISKYEWSTTAMPTDSAARILPSEGKRSSMFLDLSGNYTVELHVWDSENNRSCEPAKLTILAIPNEDIHVQLVWNTPDDPDQLDGFGSDIDLHFLHPKGRWNLNPYDVFWQNLNPDWATRRPSINNDFCQTPTSPGCHDDPSLDLDDVDGWGPENANLNNPERGVRYGVGVHYFATHGFGTSYATVRIYLGGVLKREFLQRQIDDQQFWYVADIIWSTGEIQPNGRISEGFPH